MPIPTNNKTTSPLILVLIVILGFLGGYFYYSQYQSDGVDIPVEPIDRKSSILQFESINLDLSLLTNPNFTSLKSNSSIVPGTVGKKNVFSK